MKNLAKITSTLTISMLLGGSLFAMNKIVPESIERLEEKASCSVKHHNACMQVVKGNCDTLFKTGEKALFGTRANNFFLKKVECQVKDLDKKTNYNQILNSANSDEIKGLIVDQALLIERLKADLDSSKKTFKISQDGLDILYKFYSDKLTSEWFLVGSGPDGRISFENIQKLIVHAGVDSAFAKGGGENSVASKEGTNDNEDTLAKSIVDNTQADKQVIAEKDESTTQDSPSTTTEEQTPPSTTG